MLQLLPLLAQIVDPAVPAAPTDTPWYLDVGKIGSILTAVMMLLYYFGVIKDPPTTIPGQPTTTLPTNQFDAWVLAKGFDPATITPAQRAYLEAQWRAENPSTPTNPPTTPATPIQVVPVLDKVSKVLALLLQYAPLIMPLFQKTNVSFASAELSPSELQSQLESLKDEVDSLKTKTENMA